MIKDFSLIPDVKFRRSKFKMPHDVKTSMSVGQLYPIHCQEVLAGDSWKSKINVVARVSSSFIKPVVDNAFMDVMTFFVPMRLVYDDYEKVFGNPTPSAYDDNDLSEIPHYSDILDDNSQPITTITVGEKTVLDYLGMPIGTITSDVSVLQARAFALIYDKWFRNENTTNETYIYKGEANEDELPNSNPWSNTNYTGKLPFVNKLKDYFTSCLPKPQKGASVRLPLTGFAPVTITKDGAPNVNPEDFSTNITMRFGRPGVAQSADASGSVISQINGYGKIDNGISASGEANSKYNLMPVNLQADLRSVVNADVNDMRFAFQLQKMLETDALYGSRIQEYYRSHFGVNPKELLVNTPEYLGGGKFPITVQQVAQTSAPEEGSPLGAVAGYSLTNGFSKFSKSFTEHGFVITVACVRYYHTYQQGIPKQFLRRDRNDFYDPLYAHLGEQPVYTSEIFAGTGDPKANAFGYNEAWADYRFIPNRVSGEMRTGATNSFDIWHFADNYANAPTLSDTFVKETPTFFDRTLSVPSSSVDNFLCDFYFDTSAIRVMPTYSVPGLIDHR